MDTSTNWWFGPTGHVYNTIVDDPTEIAEKDQLFEISCRGVVDPKLVTEKKYSWGIPATNERVLSHFTVRDQSSINCAETD
jgi:salicylate hydroxylase